MRTEGNGACFARSVCCLEDRVLHLLCASLAEASLFPASAGWDMVVVVLVLGMGVLVGTALSPW